MENLIRKIVKEEFQSTEKRILSRIEGIFKDENQTSVWRNMRLQFKNGISPIILTGEEIKGEDKIPLEVALIDESTGNTVDFGSESSATVEVLLLKGIHNASESDDMTVEKFNENIVPEVEGKKPLLAGNKLVKLQNGIAFLEKINLRHHVTKMRPLVFRLGARVVDMFDGVRVKEAMTQSFDVKDYRNKYYIKHKIPSLSDKVSRLVNIRKGGKIDKRLQAHKIHTVEHLLIRHLMDPEGLSSIAKTAAEKWKLTVENALACPSDKRIYFYMNDEKTMGVVFNLLGQILGLYMQRQYTSTNMLSEKHKANAEELLKSACKHWEKVEPYDGEDFLQQYFNSLDYPVGGHEDAQTSEMVGESSNRSDFSFLAVNSISETAQTSEMGGESSSRSNFSFSTVNSISESAQTSEMVGESSSRSNFSLSSVNSISESGQTSEMVGESSGRLNFSFSVVNSISETAQTSEMVGESSSRSNFSFSTVNSISESAQTSEMVGESSSRSNFSFSGVNSISKSGVEDFSSFGIDGMDIMNDDFSRLSPFCSLDFDNMFLDFDEFINRNDNRDKEIDGLINELNAGEFVESNDDGIPSKSPKRWRKLLYASKWFSIRKKVSLDRIHNRKKQKVG